MTLIRKLTTPLLAALAAGALAASPAQAIVGGTTATKGEFPSVTEVNFAVFGCTGTLIAPQWVLTAGHCGSATGAAVATPVGWPPQAFTLRIGSHRTGDGESVPVDRVLVSPSYLGLSSKHDVSLLHLSRASTKAPTAIANAAERASWDAGVTATIAGWGVTQEDGNAPTFLQKAQVPITTDAYTAQAYGADFDAATMVGAGFPQGGVDTCQGDSGGPLFTTTSGGVRRTVGATSFGEGCARPGKPGIYARVADTAIRTWIASVAPEAIAPAPAAASKRAKARSAR